MVGIPLIVLMGFKLIHVKKPSNQITFSDTLCKTINKYFKARGGIVYWDSNRNITIDTTAGSWLMIKTKGSIKDTMPILIVK